MFYSYLLRTLFGGNTESDRSEAEDWEGSRQGKAVDWEEGKTPGDEGRIGSRLIYEKKYVYSGKPLISTILWQ